MVNSRTSAEGGTPLCRGCGVPDRKLVRAHIVPQAFGRLIRQTGHNKVVHEHGAVPAKPLLGEYDTGILCAECDNALGYFDEYGIEVCRRFKREHRKLAPRLLELDNFDGDRFTKFVLAVFWRASICSRPAFASIDLGPYEDRAREVVFGQTALSQLPEFRVALLRYRSRHLDVEKFIIYPNVTASRRGIRVLRMALGGFAVVAKLDPRVFPSSWRPFFTNSAQRLRCIQVRYEDTPEFRWMMRAKVNDMLNRGERPPAQRRSLSHRP